MTDRATALALYTSGAPMKAIPAHKSVIRRWAREAGIPPRDCRSFFTHPRKDEALALYRDGLPISEICHTCKMDRWTLNKHAKAAGMRRR